MFNKLKAPKSYFLYGVLMIIPLVGLILGIVLVRKGILLKDKILFYIGSAGILMTIGFYVWAFYYGNHSQQAKVQEVNFTQFQLDRAVQEVEVYKLEHGHYPDSLQELLFRDKYASIIDPISQHFFSKKFVYFNYKKIDTTHYTLFSSGLDQVPNTADDVYPSESYLESKKFGLIRSPQ